MAVFALKAGPSLTTTPQTDFPNQTAAMNYARTYARTNNAWPVIIGTNLTTYTWKYDKT